MKKIIGLGVIFIFFTSTSCSENVKYNDLNDKLFNLILVIFVAVLALTGLIQYSKMLKKKYKQVGGIDSMYIGKYLTGHPGISVPTGMITCVITETEFLLVYLHKVMGRIPRNSINQIFVEDKSQVSQRLTVTRMLTLGIFSLAAPKKIKHNEYCLVIDWDDPQGIRHNTVFEFDNLVGANISSNKLLSYVKNKSQGISHDEIKCPYCAEIIKSEAKICRYCNSSI